MNTKLQAAWNKYGPDTFTFDILEETTPEVRREREDYWIAFYDAYRVGFNLHEGASPIRVSDETKAKLSVVNRSMPQEQRDRITAQVRITTSLPEVRAKMAESARRRGADPAERERRREVGSRPENLARLAEDRKKIADPAVRRKMAEARRGKPLAETTRAAMRETWARPDRRAILVENGRKTTARYADPAERAKQSERMHAYHADKPKECVVCGAKVVAKGQCAKHYMQASRARQKAS